VSFTDAHMSPSFECAIRSEGLLVGTSVCGMTSVFVTARQPPCRSESDWLALKAPPSTDTDECATVDLVGLEEMLDERCVDASHAVEAEVTALLGQPLEERGEGARIALRGRPHRNVEPSRRITPPQRSAQR
jgi:hypothetical protein